MIQDATEMMQIPPPPVSVFLDCDSPEANKEWGAHSKSDFSHEVDNNITQKGTKNEGNGCDDCDTNSEQNVTQEQMTMSTRSAHTVLATASRSVSRAAVAWFEEFLNGWRDELSKEGKSLPLYPIMEGNVLPRLRAALKHCPVSRHCDEHYSVVISSCVFS